MTHQEAVGLVTEVNEVLNIKPWLDIDVVSCSSQSAVIQCGIDLTIGPEIEITFSNIYFVTFLMSWKTDTSRPVLQVLSGEEAYRVNVKYQIEQGYHLFAFTPEYIENDLKFLIAARNISWRKIV